MRPQLAAAFVITVSVMVAAQTTTPTVPGQTVSGSPGEATPLAAAIEAASIKPAPPGTVPITAGAWAPPTSTSARLRPSTLRTLVMYAFDIDPQRHDPEPLGGPAWIDQNVYQLTLKFTALPTVPQAKALVRTLLEDRFRLRWHLEQRDLPVYALVVARSDGRLGPGMQPSKRDCRAYSEALARTGRGAVASEQGPECGLAGGGAPAVAAVRGLQRTFPAGTQVILGSGTMREFVTAMMRIDRENDRPIVDRTGLTGTYDIDLSWVPLRSGAIAADPGEVLPLTTAVQQQLGLKLDPRREAFDVVVIDSAELPAPD